MPLEDTDTIDLITQRGADGRYGLVITDTGVTADPLIRMDLLRQKLRRYLHAVIGGQLEETCPGSGPADFFIQVVCDLRPTREMLNISHVTTQCGALVEIPVHFTTFPDGAWQDAETGDLENATEVGEEMQQSIQLAFETAAEWLAEDHLPNFVFWLEEDGEKLAAITETGTPEEMVSRVTTWAAKFGNPAYVCILMCAVKTEESILPADTLLAYCYERGVSKGFVLMQAINLDSQSGNLVPHPKVVFVEECNNIFPLD